MVDQLRGGAELLKFLDAFPKKFANNVLRGGTRAGAKVIADGAREGAAGLRTPELKNKQHTTPGEPIADKIRVKVMVQNGLITGHIYLKGFAAAAGIWAEYGTLPHIIAIRAAKFAIGKKTVGVRTVNRNARKGRGSGAIVLQQNLLEAGLPRSLVIEGHFVGPSVQHPGASARPFMRVALDTKGNEALRAYAGYVNQRLLQGGLNAPPLDVQDDGEGE